jgi:hypothetical protein
LAGLAGLFIKRFGFFGFSNAPAFCMGQLFAHFTDFDF